MGNLRWALFTSGELAIMEYALDTTISTYEPSDSEIGWGMLHEISKEITKRRLEKDE